MPADHQAFVHVFAGNGKFCNAAATLAVSNESVRRLDTSPYVDTDNRTLVLFGEGDAIEVHVGDGGVRVLLAAGNPLRKPVVWYGPIVMNSQAELQQAFDELDRGTFLKSEAESD